MPLWAEAYFVVYVAFSLWSLFDDMRKKAEPAWYSTVEVVADVFLLGSAMTYFLVSLREFAEPALPWLFVSGLTLYLFMGGRSLRKAISDPELSIGGRYFVAASGSGLVLLFTFPLIYWGFASAILARTFGAD